MRWGNHCSRKLLRGSHNAQVREVIFTMPTRARRAHRGVELEASPRQSPITVPAADGWAAQQAAFRGDVPPAFALRRGAALRVATRGSPRATHPKASRDRFDPSCRRHLPRAPRIAQGASAQAIRKPPREAERVHSVNSWPGSSAASIPTRLRRLQPEGE